MAFTTRATSARLLSAHAPLGRHPERDELFLLPDTDRYAGTYVLGVQGAGKSGLLHSLIHRDIEAGHAVVVLDPHGDLITKCLATLPASRVSDTAVLDLEDEGYPFGANLFTSGKLHTDVARATAVERILHVFEVLWPDVLSQANLPRYVRAATITLLANPGCTLVDMYGFLLDPHIRARLLCAVTDPTVRQFWATQYDDLSDAERMRRVQPLLNRLEALFMGQALVRNVVGQRKSTISFRQAIERREVIFIRLPLKTLGNEARLIGTILLSQLSAAVFSFADLPDVARPGVSLYVDEAQNFATPDFAALFSEGRKFGVRMTLAHQYRAQLPDYLKKATMTARTKVIFTVTPEDGRELGHVFAGAPASIELNPKPVSWLLTHGHPDEAVQYFVEYYLRPLRGNRGLLKVTDTTLTGKDLFTAVFNAPALNGAVHVPDPLYALNDLCYRVMSTRDPNLPIPGEIPIGFSGCGIHTFYKAACKARAELLPDYPLPGWLAKRAPEDGSEQLMHFVASLRFAMDALAEQPIGKPLATSAIEVGKMLMSLPKRAAFVRSGEDMGVVYTLDTPEPLRGSALRERLDAIQDATRRKYCHPRENIERGFAVEPTTQDTVIAREELEQQPEPVVVGTPGPGEARGRSHPERSHWDDFLEDY